ncbi:hypothetical protein ACFS5L_21145 [Streptomyces phyllanthi]|uniref:hypothetical protein n=1 Tax=Streptomyces phyllanthi TaxID=1803180 RepID=UPI0018841254|nr:hypothetical protein [Streptomyces phyllanthi]
MFAYELHQIRSTELIRQAAEHRLAREAREVSRYQDVGRRPHRHRPRRHRFARAA